MRNEEWSGEVGRGEPAERVSTRMSTSSVESNVGREPLGVPFLFCVTTRDGALSRLPESRFEET